MLRKFSPNVATTEIELRCPNCFRSTTLLGQDRWVQCDHCGLRIPLSLHTMLEALSEYEAMRSCESHQIAYAQDYPSYKEQRAEIERAICNFIGIYPPDWATEENNNA